LKKYDTFLFDADGTLFDLNRAAANAMKLMFGYCGFNYTEDVGEIYIPINSWAWERFEKGEIDIETLRTIRFERLFDKLGIYHDPKEFNERYLYEIGKSSFLIDGAEDICREIVSRGKKIYIVTNGFWATQASRIKHSQLSEYISEFFVSELIGFQKPHIMYFEHVFSHIPDFDKKSALIIGDSLAADIAGGNIAGIDSCWLNISGGANNMEIVPTYEIKALNELKRFI